MKRPLVAPERFRGITNKYTDVVLRTKRMLWCANMGKKGYRSQEVATALGISKFCAHRLMVRGGWDAMEHKRTRPLGRKPVLLVSTKTNVDETNLRELAAQGLSGAAIGRAMGKSAHFVRKKAKECGIEIARKSPEPTTEDQVSQIRKLAGKGLGAKAISEKVGCKKREVYRAADRHDITLPRDYWWAKRDVRSDF